MSFCFSGLLCDGGLHPPDTEVTVPAIGLTAPTNGVGPLLGVRIEGLGVGTYRLRTESIEGGFAAGALEVVAEEAGLAPDEQPDPSLLVEPALVRAGETVGVTPTSTDADNAELQALRESIRPEATFQRWDGGEWRDLGVLNDIFWEDPAQVLRIDVPVSDPGAHRIVMPRAGGEPLIGRYWVAEPATLEGIAGPPTTEVTVELRDPPMYIEGFDYAVRFVSEDPNRHRGALARRIRPHTGRRSPRPLHDHVRAARSTEYRVDSHLNVGIGPGPRRPDFGGEPDGDGTELCSGPLDLTGGEPRTLVLDWGTGCLAE